MTPTLADTSNGIETRVLDLHKKFLETGKPHPNLLPFNESSINRFETLGFPHSKHEMYTFVNTQTLAANGFSLQRAGQLEHEFIQLHLYPGCESSYLVLVDGVFRPELSNPIALGTGLKISSLADAVSDPSIKKYLSESIDKENDAAVGDEEAHGQQPSHDAEIFRKKLFSANPANHRVVRFGGKKFLAKYIFYQEDFFLQKQSKIMFFFAKTKSCY